MAMCYKKLWKLLIDKNLNKSDLRERTGLSTTTIAKLGRDEYVSMEVVSKICATLQCDVGDIMEYVSDENWEDWDLKINTRYGEYYNGRKDKC